MKRISLAILALMVQRMYAEIRRLQSERDQLAAQVEKLREALEKLCDVRKQERPLDFDMMDARKALSLSASKCLEEHDAEARARIAELERELGITRLMARAALYPSSEGKP